MTIYEALVLFVEEERRCTEQGREQMAEAYRNAIRSIIQCIKEMWDEL